MLRTILHVDLDAFYASVEQRDNPELRCRPVLVGGRSGRGVVLAASYEARPFGCRSAIPMAKAIRLCPQAIIVRPRFEAYRAASEQVFSIFERFTPEIEPLSIDEAFLDVTASTRLFGDGPAIAEQIRTLVKSSTGLTCSVGVAPNKYLAKLASDHRKPDGLFVVRPGEIQPFLDALPVGRVWGVGPKAEHALALLNVRTGRDLRELSEARLVQEFGAWGRKLYSLARGIDDRPVVPDRQAKGIGHEETFHTDIGDPDILTRILVGQVDHVCRRLRRASLAARTITLKLRLADFSTFSRGHSIAEPTDRTDLWIPVARALFDEWCRSTRQGEGVSPLRLVGVRLSQFSAGGPAQLGLFQDPAAARRQRVDRATDTIESRFGKGSITRAGAMKPGADEPPVHPVPGRI